MKKFLPKTSHNPQGFTLIELMIVIAIIAILAVIGISVFGNVQKTARNARRQADLKAMSTAMEVSYNDSAGSYYGLNGAMFASGVIPKNTDGNDYTGVSGATATVAGGYLTGNAYTFSAVLESPVSTISYKNQRNP